ncbi:hypothetical protein KY358_04205, partial [Candidatus Woesearchaeota archaeon]|nr:hypothetical protein [Candidatus Woesearchaeota archaeon]
MLEYKAGTAFDTDDDGIEYIPGGVVDITAENSFFSWDVDQSRLCTEWHLNFPEGHRLCYGSMPCCSFIGLEPSLGEWDEPFSLSYGRYGASFNNTVDSRLIYVDYNLTPGEPYAHIYNSSRERLYALFIESPKIVTKLIAVFFERIRALTGAIIRVSSFLRELNETPLTFRSVSLYVNDAYIETKETDILGGVVFELNDSLGLKPPYIINLTYKGEKIMIGQRTIEYLPSHAYLFVLNNASNATGSDETDITLDPAVRDSSGKEIGAEVEIRGMVQGRVEARYKKEKKPGRREISARKADREIRVIKGRYRIRVNISRGPVRKIEFNDVELRKNMTRFLGIDEVDENKIKEKSFVNAYAIDPSNLNFTDAVVTVTAAGTSLYKCQDWDFEGQACEGEWELFKSGLVPGEEYTFKLTPEDPGFGEVIEITKAVHLDKDKSFVSDIYNQTRELDGVWSGPVSHGEYVRVTFEKNLTSGNDITLYPGIVDGDPKIEVYELDGTEVVAEFSGISPNQYNKVYLDGLAGTQDAFDLKILSGTLELDHIVDPSFTNGTLASDISLSPLTTTSFVAAWVDVNETDISFRIMDTNGSIILDTV